MSDIASIAQTGGRGYGFEDCVAVTFLLKMLQGDCYWGKSFGNIIQLNWQTRADNWYLDDLCISTKDETGQTHHIAISIKSNSQINSSGFPHDFTANVWEQWLSSNGPFEKERDLLVLALGSIAEPVFQDWSSILKEVLEGDTDRIENRISVSGAWSESKKRIFSSLANPDNSKSSHSETIVLIKHIRVLRFDFLANPSFAYTQLQADARNLCLTHCPQDEELLLSKLFECAKNKRETGGSCVLKDLYRLSGLPSLVGHPNYYQDLDKLCHVSQEEIIAIKDTVANGFSFPRNDLFAKIKEKLDGEKRIILLGQSGIGKSALAKKLFENSKATYKIWFSSRSWERLRLDNPVHIIIENIPSNNALIVFDAIDRLEQAEKDRINSLVRHAQMHGHSVIMTAINRSSCESSCCSFIEIPPLTEDDINDLFRIVPNISHIGESKGMKSLIGIPKILDWLIELTQQLGQASLSLSSFSEHIWNKWINAANPSRKYCRAQLLKELAELDAEKLKAGIPISKISDHATLGELENDNILEIRDELIYWTHDLIGDWARERILIEHASDFLSFVEHKFSILQWKYPVLLFGQWLLDDEAQRSFWTQYVLEADGELQGLLLDSIIYSGNSYEICCQLRDNLLADKCLLLNKLLDRLFLVAVNYEKEQGNEPLFPFPNLLLRCSILEFLHEEQKNIIQHCHYRVSELCLWFNMLLPTGHWASKRSADLAINTAIFWYQKEKSQRTEKSWNDHLYLENEQIDIIWCAFLRAYEENPEKVMQQALIFAERTDIPFGNSHYEDDEIEEQTEEDHFLRGEYIPAWSIGPKREICRRFREVCLNGNLLIPMFSKDPMIAAEILKAVCIEAPHYDDYGSSLLEQGGFYCGHDLPGVCGYFRGPWLLLLEKYRLKGLEAIIELINFATERFVAEGQREEQRRSDESKSDLTKILRIKDYWEANLLSPIENEPITWIGDSRVFGWYRHRLIDSETIASMLMALEKWLYDQAENKVNIDDVISYIITNNKSVAIAGILCALAKKAPELLDGKLRFIISAWVFFRWDLTIQNDEHCWEIGFDLTYRRLGEGLYNKALAWNQLAHRKISYQDTCIINFVTNSINNTNMDWFEQVVSFWKEQNSKDESLPFLIAKFTRENYSLVNGDNGQEVHFQFPTELQQVSSQDQQKHAFTLAKLHYPFECQKIIDENIALTHEQTDVLWQEMQEIALALDKKNTEEKLAEEVISEELCNSALIYCAGIAATTSGNPDYIIKSADRLTWTLDKLFSIRNNPPPRTFYDFPTSIGNWFWDIFWSEAAILLYKYCNKEDATPHLLASSICVFHYSAIEKALLCARKSLSQESDLIRLINLHIAYSMARGLSYYESEDSAFGDIAHRKIFDYYNSFIDNKIDDKKIIEIQGLYTEYRSIRDKQLGFSIPLMRISEKLFARIYGNILYIANKVLRRKKRADVDRKPWLDNISNVPLSKFKEIYLHRYSRHSIADLRQMVQYLVMIDFNNTKNFSYNNQVTLLLETQKLILMQLQVIPDREKIDHNDSHGYPDEAESACLQKIALSLVHMKADDPKKLWMPVLGLPEYFHDWGRVFIGFWFCSDLKTEEDFKKFGSIWEEMLIFAQNSSVWKSNSCDISQLWIELLGMNIPQSIWKDANFVPIVTQMKPYYLRWAKERLKYYDALSSLMHFCLSDIGHILIQEVTLIISDTLNNDQPRIRDNTPELFARFCGKIWKDYSPSLDMNKEFERAFLNILSIAVAHNSHSAQKLCKEIEEHRNIQ